MRARRAAVLLAGALLAGVPARAGADCLDGPLRGVIFRSSPGRDGTVLYDLQVRNPSRETRLAVTVRFAAPGVERPARGDIYLVNPGQGLRAVLGRGRRELSEEEMRAATAVSCYPH